MIQQLRERLADLAKELPLSLAVLFGSYARGDYTVASDLDLLIVYSGKERPDAFARAKKLLDIPLLQPHVYSEKEYEALRETIERMIAGGVLLFPDEEMRDKTKPTQQTKWTRPTRRTRPTRGTK